MEILMEDQINILKKLQAIDSQIYSLKKEKDLKPLELGKINEDHNAKAGAFKKIEEELKALQMLRKSREMDLEAKETNVKKFQGQLSQVKTNKEYSALQGEIEGLKSDNSLLEEEILILFDKIDQLKARIEASKALLDASAGNVKGEEAKITSLIKEIDLKIDRLNSERLAIISSVDKNILSRYERILVNKNGLALVPVKNDSCGGCHLNLPPQVINEISMKDKVITCGSCTRILYIEE